MGTFIVFSHCSLLSMKPALVLNQFSRVGFGVSTSRIEFSVVTSKHTMYFSQI